MPVNLVSHKEKNKRKKKNQREGVGGQSIDDASIICHSSCSQRHKETCSMKPVRLVVPALLTGRNPTWPNGPTKWADRTKPSVA